MAKLINQTRFDLGEVDPLLGQSTAEPQYQQALSYAENVYINSQRLLVKRSGNSSVFSSRKITDNVSDPKKGIKQKNCPNV